MIKNFKKKYLPKFITYFLSITVFIISIFSLIFTHLGKAFGITDKKVKYELDFFDNLQNQDNFEVFLTPNMPTEMFYAGVFNPNIQISSPSACNCFANLAGQYNDPTKSHRASSNQANNCACDCSAGECNSFFNCAKTDMFINPSTGGECLSIPFNLERKYPLTSYRDCNCYSGNCYGNENCWGQNCWQGQGQGYAVNPQTDCSVCSLGKTDCQISQSRPCQCYSGQTNYQCFGGTPKPTPRPTSTPSPMASPTPYGYVAQCYECWECVNESRNIELIGFNCDCVCACVCQTSTNTACACACECVCQLEFKATWVSTMYWGRYNTTQPNRQSIIDAIKNYQQNHPGQNASDPNFPGGPSIGMTIDQFNYNCVCVCKIPSSYYGTNCFKGRQYRAGDCWASTANVNYWGHSPCSIPATDCNDCVGMEVECSPKYWDCTYLGVYNPQWYTPTIRRYNDSNASSLYNVPGAHLPANFFSSSRKYFTFQPE